MDSIIRTSFYNIETAIHYRFEWWKLSIVADPDPESAPGHVPLLQNAVNLLGRKLNEYSWEDLDDKDKNTLLLFAKIILGKNPYCWFTNRIVFEGALWDQVFQALNKRNWSLLKKERNDSLCLRPLSKDPYLRALTVTWVEKSFLVMEYCLDYWKEKKCTIFVNPVTQVIRDENQVKPNFVVLTDGRKEYCHKETLNRLEEDHPLFLQPKKMHTAYLHTTLFKNGDHYILNNEDYTSISIRTFSPASTCSRRAHTYSVAFSFLQKTYKFLNVLILGQFYCCSPEAITDHCNQILYEIKKVDFLFISLESCLRFRRPRPLEIIECALSTLKPEHILIFEVPAERSEKYHKLASGIMKCSLHSQMMESLSETLLFRFESSLQNKSVSPPHYEQGLPPFQK